MRRAPSSSKLNLTLQGPFPVPYLGLVDSLGESVVDAFNDLPFEPVFKMRSGILQPGHAIDDVNSEIKAVNLIADREFQRSVDIPFLFVAANMQIGVIGSAVGKFVNEPGISVEIKDYRLVSGEERVKVTIGETMRMF
jgi:hypothetical protein